MEEYLNVNQVAKRLGVSKWTVYGWVSMDFIPYCKLQGSLRFRASSIDSWASKNEKPGRTMHRLNIEKNTR